MAILTFFYKNGLWLSWPVFGLGVFLLWFFIMTVIRLGDKNRLCSLPLEAEQSVEFSEAGQVILWLEGPLLTTRFGGLSFELTGIDGSSLQGRMALFRQGSSGFSKVRIADPGLQPSPLPAPIFFMQKGSAMRRPATRSTGSYSCGPIFPRP